MNNVYYKRIEIKGDEKNLPKVDDIYWVHNKKSEKMKGLLSQYSFHNNKEVWLENIDWYLIPFTPDSKAVIMPTEEEVNEKYPTEPKIIASRLKLPENFTESVWQFLVKIAETNENIRSAIKWYRSQVREVELKSMPETIVGVTELNEKQKELIEMYAMILIGFKLSKDEAVSELTKMVHLILEK